MWSSASMGPVTDRLYIARLPLHLVAIVLLGGFSIGLAVTRGWVPISAYSHPDPHLFVHHSTRIARTGELLHEQDPPLRYIPLVVFYVLQSPSPELAGRAASLYAAVWTYVLTPLAGYALVRVHASRGMATIGTAGMLLGFWFSAIPTGFSGPWQYAVALPYAYAALYCSARTLDADPWSWPLAGGLLLGVTALTQILVAGFTAVVIGIAFASASRYRSLARIAAVSIVTASPLVLLPRLVKHSSIFLKTDIIGAPTRHAIFTGSGPWGILASFVSLQEILRSVASPRFLALVGILVVAVAVASRWNVARRQESELLTTLFLAGGLLWFVWSVTTMGYVGDRVMLIVAPLALAVASAGVAEAGMRSVKPYLADAVAVNSDCRTD